MGYVGALANVPGQTFRTQLNSALQELARRYTGPLPPDPVYADMIWRDTATFLIKCRNGSNTAWTVVGTFDSSGNETRYIGGLAPAAAATRLSNLAATAAPTVNDDTGDGYGVGSIWCDGTNDRAYICVDPQAGNAQWPRISWGQFTQDVAGVVPGPTAADIAALRVLNAAGAWVAPSEWTPIQAYAPDGLSGTLGYENASLANYRRLRLRLDGMRPSVDGVDLSITVHAGGAWRTVAGDYVSQARYQTTGQQYLATPAPVQLDYTGVKWGNAAGEDGTWEIMLTSTSRVNIAAQGGYGSTAGVRCMTQVEAISTFAGPATGCAAVLSSGVFAAGVGRLTLEGAYT